MPPSEANEGGRVEGDREAAMSPGTTRSGPAPSSSTASAGEPALRVALRRARVDEAERARAVGDLHAVEVARLEVLLDRLQPLAASLPADADLFDFALVPAPRPRLFVDMIGFVEMAADRRRYRLVQDTRDGRLVLHEGEGLDAAVEAVTGYVARRLVEREKMLATVHAPRLAQATRPGSAGRRAWLARAGRLALEHLGIVALVVLLWVLGQAVFQWATRV